MFPSWRTANGSAFREKERTGREKERDIYVILINGEFLGGGKTRSLVLAVMENGRLVCCCAGAMSSRLRPELPIVTRRDLLT